MKQAYIDESGTIKMRSYKRTKGYRNVNRYLRTVGQKTFRNRKHKIAYSLEANRV